MSPPEQEAAQANIIYKHAVHKYCIHAVPMFSLRLSYKQLNVQIAHKTK